MSVFKRKPKHKHHFEIGGFIVDFYTDEKVVENNFATINTISKNFSLRVTGYPFGYLMASVKDGETENLHGFCALMHLIADGVYQDAGFANDLMKSVTKYQKRLLKSAEKEAKATTDEQIQADEALINDVLYEQTLNEQDLAQKRAEDKEILKSILTDKE